MYVLVAYFTGRAVSGWASLILSLWFIGGCVLIGLGIVGEYLGCVFNEVKRRPGYFINSYNGNRNDASSHAQATEAES